MPPTPSQANLEGLSEGQRVEELQSQLAEAELKTQLAEMQAQLTNLQNQRVLRENQRLRDAATTAAATTAAAATAADATAAAVAANKGSQEREQSALQAARTAQRVSTAGAGTVDDPMEM